MKLEAVSSKSGVLKIINLLMFLVMSSTEEKIVQVTQHDYYGTGFPPLIRSVG